MTPFWLLGKWSKMVRTDGRTHGRTNGQTHNDFERSLHNKPFFSRLKRSSSRVRVVSCVRFLFASLITWILLRSINNLRNSEQFQNTISQTRWWHLTGLSSARLSPWLCQHWWLFVSFHCRTESFFGWSNTLDLNFWNCLIWYSFGKSIKRMQSLDSFDSPANQEKHNKLWFFKKYFRKNALFSDSVCMSISLEFSSFRFSSSQSSVCFSNLSLSSAGKMETLSFSSRDLRLKSGNSKVE